MHIERRENPFKSSERAESERDQRHIDKVFGGMSFFSCAVKCNIASSLSHDSF